MNDSIRQHHYSALFLEMYYKNENEDVCTCLASGTGFQVYSSDQIPYLITNRHNVTGKDSQGYLLSPNGAVPNMLKVYFRSSYNPDTVIEHDIPLYQTEEIVPGEEIWYEHPRWQNNMDCVAIRLENINGIAQFPQNLNDLDRFEKTMTDTVSVIGYPFGLKSTHESAIWATGFIATDPHLDYNNFPKFLIDCRSRQGQSGSPVVAYNRSGQERLSELPSHTIISGGDTSQFLGIYSGRINKESDLGIVWKASAIKELVDSI